MNDKATKPEYVEQSDNWLIACPDCGAKEAIAYRPDVLDYDCPVCHQSFSAHELVHHQNQLKQQYKLSRIRLLAIGALVILLLAIIPILTVRIERDEIRNSMRFTAPGVQVIVRSKVQSGPELQFYLIGNYLGRWQLSPRPVIEPASEPTSTPAPTEQQTPTPFKIPKPATLDSA